MTALASIEAEQSVLGTLLMENGLYDRLDSVLSPEDFSEGIHGRIYDLATRMIAGGRVASPVTMQNVLAAELERAGLGDGYLARLAGESLPLSVAIDHAKLIRSLSVRRRLAQLAREAADAAEHGQEDAPEALVESLQASLDGLLASDVREDTTSMAEALRDACLGIEAAYQHKGQITGTPTGFAGLDRHLGGLEKQALYIIAGRPGMGKSAMAGCMALNMARDGKCGVFYSLEMGARELAQRFISQVTGIPAQDMKRGNIHDVQYRMIRDAEAELSEVPLTLDARGGISTTQLQARARRHRRKHGLDFIVVDYLQLMQGSGKRRGDNRTNEITEITMGLKALAKELDIPVIALSQLNRGLEARADKRPMLSDLRESGSIEQDADVILFVYRDHYYLKNEKPPKKDDERAAYYHALNNSDGMAEVIVAKFRNGPTGTVHMAFEDKTMTFRDGE